MAMNAYEAYQMRENYYNAIRESDNKPVKKEEPIDQSLMESLTKINNKGSYITDLGKFKNNTKDVFLFEALYTTLDKSIAGSSNIYIQPLMRAMVKNYITESGGTECVLNKMRTKTLFLSEMCRIVEKYSDIVNEAAEKIAVDTNDASDLTIPSDVKDSFYDELDKTEIDDVTQEIRNRVSDSVNDFIDQNAKNKEEIEEIISKANDAKAQTTDQLDSDQDRSEEIKESYDHNANKKINNILNSNKSVLSYFVEAVSLATMKDKQLLAESSTNGQIDYDKIMDKAGTMYTMLEMLNTTKLEKVDANYIRDIIDNL